MLSGRRASGDGLLTVTIGSPSFNAGTAVSVASPMAVVFVQGSGGQSAFGNTI